MEKKMQLLVIVPPMTLSTEFIEKLSNAFTVFTMDNEEDAYRFLIQRTANISAVLLDLDLARQSNFSFVDKISMDKLFTSIPVIALSPRLPNQEDIDCLKHGFSELLTPPNENGNFWKSVSTMLYAPKTPSPLTKLSGCCSNFLLIFSGRTRKAAMYS